MVSSFVTVPVGETAYGNIDMNLEAETAYAAELDATDPEIVEKVVREYFKDIPVMAEVARCESHFRHAFKDGTVLKGVVDKADTGVMQINLRYHEKRATDLGLNVHNLSDNLAYARVLYEEKGTQPWKASKPCWGKKEIALSN